MTRIFSEGFEAGTTSLFDYYVGGVNFHPTLGRNGQYAMRMDNTYNGNYAGFYFSELGENEVWIRIAHCMYTERTRLPNNPSGTEGALFYISDSDRFEGGNALMTVAACEGGLNGMNYYFLQGDIDDDWDDFNISVPSYTAGSSSDWHLIEIHLLDNGNGTVLVEGRVDGTIIATGTLYKNISTFRYFGFGSRKITANFIPRFLYDDFAVNNNAGTVNNSWCNDGFIGVIVPDGVGSRTELTPDSGDNWQRVSELPPNGDTSYVEGNTSGLGDLYTMSGISLLPTEEIVMVQPITYARRVDAASTSRMRTLLKSGTVTVNGSYTDLTTSYSAIRGDVYETDPNTNAAWTENGINSLEAGIELE